MTTTQPSTAAAATHLAEALNEHVEGIDQARRVPPTVYTLFEDSGLMRTSQPRRWGGTEASFADQLRAVETVAKVSPSAAWTLGVYISHNWNLSLFSEQAQHDVWADNPLATACTSAVGGPPAERVDGGARIAHGKWTFLSGIHNTDWIVVNSPLPDSADSENVQLYSLLVPRGQYTIVDDWNTVGLAGTGTCSAVLNDVFVPEHRILPFSQQQEGTTPGGQWHASPMYRAPLDAIWPAYLAVPGLGAAAGLIDQWVGHTRGRVNAYTRQPSANEAFKHFRLAESEATLDSARLLFYRDVDAVTDTVANGGSIDELRSRNRRDFAYTARTAATVAESMFHTSGARSLSMTNPIQRFWRDAHAVTQHAMFEYERSLSAWGRRRLGVDDGTTF